MHVHEALSSRQSARGFLDRPVAREILRRVLRYAGMAPSGSNIQPWRVWVLEGAARQRLIAATMARRNGDGPDGVARTYDYYPPTWREPYLARRRACGWGLYGTLGIARGDHAGMRAQHDRNFVFFDAPVALIFSIERDLTRGSWFDFGMFVQSLMLAARAEDLHTCAQAAWLDHHDLVREATGMPDGEDMVCGMSLGYLDEGAPANRFRTGREDVDTFATFVDR